MNWMVAFSSIDDESSITIVSCFSLLQKNVYILINIIKTIGQKYKLKEIYSFFSHLRANVTSKREMSNETMLLTSCRMSLVCALGSSGYEHGEHNTYGRTGMSCCGNYLETFLPS